MLAYTMRLGICDNDPADLDRLTRMVQDIAAQAGITCEMTLYQSAAALLHAIENGAEYHALLLDVMMDEMACRQTPPAEKPDCHRVYLLQSGYGAVRLRGQRTALPG